MIDTIKEVVAVGTVLFALGAGYTGIQKDVATVQTEVIAVKEVEQKHNDYIQQDAAATARIDERTKAMQEQLNRIEKGVTGAK